jgi:hypothetical protein
VGDEVVAAAAARMGSRYGEDVAGAVKDSSYGGPNSMVSMVARQSQGGAGRNRFGTYISILFRNRHAWL